MLGSQEMTNLLTPEQQQFLSSALGGTGQAGEAYGQFLQPQSQEDMQAAFQKGVVDPMMQTYEQQTVPALQQRFVDAGAGSSSAMNQALSQSAQDLTTSLGSQYLPFMQGQKQNTLTALGQLGGLAGQQAFQPLMKGGLADPLLKGLGAAGGGMLAKSSATIKENIRPYHKGLGFINELDVKQYDYIESEGGLRNRVGLIAESVPHELGGTLGGVRAVDVYGLVGVLINAVKELGAKIALLEAK